MEMAQIFSNDLLRRGQLGVVSCPMAFGDLHPPARMVLSGHLYHRDAPTKDKGERMKDEEEVCRD
jgi:hypothetical protein